MSGLSDVDQGTSQPSSYRRVVAKLRDAVCELGGAKEIPDGVSFFIHEWKSRTGEPVVALRVSEPRQPDVWHSFKVRQDSSGSDGHGACTVFFAQTLSGERGRSVFWKNLDDAEHVLPTTVILRNPFPRR